MLSHHGNAQWGSSPAHERLQVPHRYRRANAQWGSSPAHYRLQVPHRYCEGGHVPLIIRMVRCSTTKIFASGACCPFPTSMPTQPGQQAPLAASAFRLDCLHANPPPPQSIKMRRLAPASPPFVLAVFIPLHRHEPCMTKHGACS